MASLSPFQTSLFLVGTLIVVWAGLFSFFEVRRIAAGRFTSIYVDGSDSRIDPDAPRVVTVEPPTDEATPHHENHLGSEGLDQGQLTSQIPDTFPFAVTPMRLRATKKLREEPFPNSTKHYFQGLGKRILESLDEDPEIEPGQADTTPGNADTDKEPEKKSTAPLANGTKKLSTIGALPDM